MPFTGTFDILNFTDVLKLLGGKQLTGRLHVRSRSIGANLYLDSGLLVGADVGDHQTTSPTDVRSRMEEICFELLEAERGTFEFLPDTPTAAQYPVSVEIDAVLDQARKRLEEWRKIQAVIPSFDLHPRIVSDIGRDEVTVTRERWRLMTVIDGRRSIRAIARSIGASDYDVCRTLKDLVDEGMVAVDPPNRAIVTRRTPAVFIDDSAGQAEAELDALVVDSQTAEGHIDEGVELAAAEAAEAAPAAPASDASEGDASEGDAATGGDAAPARDATEGDPGEVPSPEAVAEGEPAAESPRPARSAPQVAERTTAADPAGPTAAAPFAGPSEGQTATADTATPATPQPANGVGPNGAAARRRNGRLRRRSKSTERPAP